MKLKIDGIDIVQFKDRSCVRISMGDYIYLDTPFFPNDKIQPIFDNIAQRIDHIVEEPPTLDEGFNEIITVTEDDEK